MEGATIEQFVVLPSTVVGLVSPLVNSSYEYVIAFLRPGSDIARLLYALPPLAVHSYFAVTLTVYVLGLLAILIFPTHVLKRPIPITA